MPFGRICAGPASSPSGLAEEPNAKLLDASQAAIGAGVDPEALTEAINEAQAERAAARAELGNRPAPEAITAN